MGSHGSRCMDQDTLLTTMLSLDYTGGWTCHLLGRIGGDWFLLTLPLNDPLRYGWCFMTLFGESDHHQIFTVHQRLLESWGYITRADSSFMFCPLFFSLWSIVLHYLRFPGIPSSLKKKLEDERILRYWLNDRVRCARVIVPLILYLHKAGHMSKENHLLVPWLGRRAYQGLGKLVQMKIREINEWIFLNLGKYTCFLSHPSL